MHQFKILRDFAGILAKSLDAIIHNAGIAYNTPADVMTDQERRHVFDGAPRTLTSDERVKGAA